MKKDEPLTKFVFKADLLEFEEHLTAKLKATTRTMRNTIIIVTTLTTIIEILIDLARR